MPILKETRIEDAVTFRATGHIEIREATIILRDGVEIARTYHRRTIAPGEDIAAEGGPAKALAGCWTQDQIDRVRNVPDLAKPVEAAGAAAGAPTR